MPDIPLSVRLPAELTVTLARCADERGVGRSMVVREAFADCLAAWPTAPKLMPDEAASFAADIRADRETLGPLDDPWV